MAPSSGFISQDARRWPQVETPVCVSPLPHADGAALAASPLPYPGSTGRYHYSSSYRTAPKWTEEPRRTPLTCAWVCIRVCVQHYGQEVVAALMDLPVQHKDVQTVYLAVYKGFIEVCAWQCTHLRCVPAAKSPHWGPLGACPEAALS